MLINEETLELYNKLPQRLDSADSAGKRYTIARLMGVDQQQLNGWLQRKKFPDLDTYQRFEDAVCDVHSAEFEGGELPSPPEVIKTDTEQELEIRNATLKLNLGQALSKIARLEQEVNEARKAGLVLGTGDIFDDLRVLSKVIDHCLAADRNLTEIFAGSKLAR